MESCDEPVLMTVLGELRQVTQAFLRPFSRIQGNEGAILHDSSHLADSKHKASMFKATIQTAHIVGSQGFVHWKGHNAQHEANTNMQ
eukprot:4518238-Amphidinium_carterae.1